MGTLGPFHMVTVQRKETSQCLVKGSGEDLGGSLKCRAVSL